MGDLWFSRIQVIKLLVFWDVTLYRLTCTWSDNKVRERIAVKVLHTSLMNTTMVAFKVLPLGSYAPMPAPSPSSKANFETGFVEWPSEMLLH